jgi:hypothetical protein
VWAALLFVLWLVAEGQQVLLAEFVLCDADVQAATVPGFSHAVGCSARETRMTRPSVSPAIARATQSTRDKMSKVFTAPGKRSS